MSDKPGIPTYHTRVERWQSDFNDHWNLRFFCESFQMAAEVAATRSGTLSPGTSVIRSRHLRLHKELFVATPVQVRSARLSDPLPGMSGTLPVAHFMYGAGELSATAIDFPGTAALDLPVVNAEDVPAAMPKGIPAEPVMDLTEAPGLERRIPLGPVQLTDLDHTGHPGFGPLIRFVAIGAHDYHNFLGFTPEYAASDRISRMTLETWMTLGKAVPAGRIVEAVSSLVSTRGRTFTTRHQLRSDDGEVVATFEQCLAAVHLDTRRAVALPEFVTAARANVTD